MQFSTVALDNVRNVFFLGKSVSAESYFCFFKKGKIGYDLVRYCDDYTINISNSYILIYNL